MKKIILAAALSLLTTQLLASEKEWTTQQIVDCVRNNVPNQLRVQTIELTATDASGGIRVLSGKLYGMRQTLKGSGQSVLRANLRIDAPASLAGASYLIREATTAGAPDGLYVYLPSVQRVKRITGGFADGSLLGTNFSYNDFKQMQTAFIRSTVTMEGAEKLHGRDTRILGFKVAPSPEGSYSRIRSWVDEESCLPIQTEFYQGNTLRKKLTVGPASIRQSGKMWYVSESEMTDLSNGTKTVLKILKVDTEMPLPENLFSKDSFYKIPIAAVK